MNETDPNEDLCAASTLAEIAALPQGAIVTSSALVRAYRFADQRGVKRLIENGELPPPARMNGRHVWTAGSLIKHFDRLMEEAQKVADEKKRVMKKHSA